MDGWPAEIYIFARSESDARELPDRLRTGIVHAAQVGWACGVGGHVTIRELCS